MDRALRLRVKRGRGCRRLRSLQLGDGLRLLVLVSPAPLFGKAAADPKDGTDARTADALKLGSLRLDRDVDGSLPGLSGILPLNHEADGDTPMNRRADGRRE